MDLQASTASRFVPDNVDQDCPHPIVSPSSPSVGDPQASAAIRLVRAVDDKRKLEVELSSSPFVGTCTLDDEAASYAGASNLYVHDINVSDGTQLIVLSSSRGPPESADTLTQHNAQAPAYSGHDVAGLRSPSSPSPCNQSLPSKT